MYELFDFENNKITFDQLDNKAFWCAHGERQEKAFVKIFDKLKNEGSLKTKFHVAIHPEKDSNPYHPDLLIDGKFIGDAKIKNSPLFMANTYLVSPQYALTMDLKDVFNYRKRLLSRNQDVYIFAWVKWEAHKMVTQNRTYSVNKMGGIWVSKISDILSYLQEKKVGIHWYKERFRHAPYSGSDHAWGRELLEFESRLLFDGKVRNISSNGFITRGENGVTYPAGHSSCSYVFDLSNSRLFEQLYLKM